MTDHARGRSLFSDAADTSLARTPPLLLWVRVVGHSMAPTILDGEMIWVRRRRPRSLVPGDIVVFRNPLDSVEPRFLVKRVTRVVDAWSTTRSGGFEVRGDNPHSLGSAQLGFIASPSVVGVAVWPRRLRRMRGGVM
jgi:phage repressor protein C with HTH and peptisase S24 domain